MNEVIRKLFRSILRTPVPRWIARVRTDNDRGASLEPDVALLLTFARIMGEGADPTVEEARTKFEMDSQLVEGPAQDLASIRDLAIAGRPARLYTPQGETHGRLLVYFHGGGWVVGGLRSHDRLCQALAAEGNQRVLSCTYRRAPESPFPEPVFDAVAAFREARLRSKELGAVPEHIAIGGDSAGGNLAAVTAMQLREAGEPQPAFQLLIYPATDFRRQTQSHQKLAHGYFLTKERLDWYEDRYAPEKLDVRCSPLLAADHSGLAPAIIVNAGFDPLRDDGELYGDALRRAGVPVDQHDYPGQIHGFLSMAGALPSAARAVTEVARNCTKRYL